MFSLGSGAGGASVTEASSCAELSVAPSDGARLDAFVDVGLENENPPVFDRGATEEEENGLELDAFPKVNPTLGAGFVAEPNENPPMLLDSCFAVDEALPKLKPVLAGARLGAVDEV